MLRRLALVAGVLAALAVVPLLAIALDAPEPGVERASAAGKGRSADARLRGFGSCAALHRYARRHEEAVSYPAVTEGDVVAPVDGAPGEAGGAADSAPGSSVGSSTPTNVQEAGIDEPDIVKADGSRAFAIAGGKLHAVDLSGDAPRLAASIDLAKLGGEEDLRYASELLLSGDRLIVIGQGYGTPSGGGGGAEIAIYPSDPRTTVHEIDVSDPAAMKPVRTLRVEGGFVDARLAGTTARLVVSSFPAYPFAEPQPARRSKAKVIPTATLQDHAAGTSETERILPCRDVRRPRRFSGLEMLSLLTIDLSRGLDPTDVDSIMTHGETVYGSPGAIYVATEQWLPPDASDSRASSITTAIHKFAIDSPSQSRYAASGEVDGFMLSQWSLSEQDDLLRIASTAESPEFDVGERESFVTVLAEKGDRLVQVGRVGGLGRGERIYAVRFIGDVGYVVTFRQVDPLYTVDLSTPTDPKVIGELKVPGYSAYLHPVGEGLILGVGQDATEQGRTLGTLVSLFDVSDLASPAGLDRVAMGEGSSSEVEYDHHAFLHYAPTGLVVLPLEVYGSKPAQTFAGAVGLRVGAAGIDEIARVSHPATSGGEADGAATVSPVRRSFVAGGRLYTVSESGLAAHDLATLATQSFVPFG